MTMRGRAYIEELASNGRYHFSSNEALHAIGSSQAAVRAQLRRLKEQGLIAEPTRSFHVIVPPEYRRIRCLPAEQFVHQLMDVWGEPYYLGLLSAAERYGAAHQRPQACQVMVRKNRAALSCGKVRVEFIARGDLEKMPFTTINTPRGVLRYATPEVTALELMGYPRHAGGVSNVATVTAELAEGIDAAKLLEAARLSPVGWSQRLGYLLELVGRKDLAKTLEPFVEEQAKSYTPLRRAAAIASAKRSAKWKIIINAEVEPDT
jgi:predicted transcriptional regulator of viral defense system